jgi:hypothetical protein
MEAKAVISEIEMEVTVERNEMIKHLQIRECVVLFKKVDGTERRMRCTLNDQLIENGTIAEREVKARNENTIAVWDIENKGWRSFRVDSVIDFNALATPI